MTYIRERGGRTGRGRCTGRPGGSGADKVEGRKEEETYSDI